MLAVTLDPDGRRVGLTNERWEHIKARHAELTGRMRDLMAAVREPDARGRGRAAGEEWFATREAGSELWMFVAVHYEGDEGWIATAFRRDRLPR
jgi:hypothetical protein